MAETRSLFGRGMEPLEPLWQIYCAKRDKIGTHRYIEKDKEETDCPEIDRVSWISLKLKADKICMESS